MTAYSKSAWYPIAAETDLPFRHVFHAMLLGREFTVWRADDDTVNVWEKPLPASRRTAVDRHQ
jgi:hypothetical protein